MTTLFTSSSSPQSIKPVDRPLLTPEGADYVEIVHSHVKDIDPGKIQGEGQPADIAFYCRQCKKMIEKPERVAKTLRFKCPECGTERVSFGGRDSIQNYYRLKEERKEAKSLLENM